MLEASSPKSRCQQGHAPSEVSRGNHSCLFILLVAPCNPQHSLACGSITSISTSSFTWPSSLCVWVSPPFFLFFAKVLQFLQMDLIYSLLGLFLYISDICWLFWMALSFLQLHLPISYCWYIRKLLVWVSASLTFSHFYEVQWFLKSIITEFLGRLSDGL